MDIGTILGLLIGVGGILLGNLIEGGKFSQIMQPTAAMIVLGGTIGATMIQFPFRTFIRAVKSVRTVFQEPQSRTGAVIEEIVGYATIARKDGILSLEGIVGKSSDPFLTKALMMAIDGADSTAMRESLEPAIGQIEEAGEDAAKVFEAAGGFSPTIGIIGAVLGLIQVMSNLSDIAKVGEGIATAFVATIYGVGFANLIALPIGGKLKLRNREAVAARELMLEGALAIQQGLNPKLIRERLSSLHAAPEAPAKPASETASEQADAVA
ncbi:MAG: flagellar motor protein [Deltaproteobacteria bacterium]|nr:flagellar motor protein [Deltaproteobacteria bacterium]